MLVTLLTSQLLISVTIILKNVAYTANLLTNMIANGNLVLESTGPTLAITGSGGIYIDKNTISNIQLITVTAPIFQLLISWLKEVAVSNI
jgi:hypothetical protein